MFLLRLFELTGIVLIAAFIFTQIVLPLFKGGKLFPLFRKSRSTIENEIVETQELLREKELKETLASLRAELNEPTDQSDTDQKS